MRLDQIDKQRDGILQIAGKFIKPDKLKSFFDRIERALPEIGFTQDKLAKLIGNK